MMSKTCGIHYKLKYPDSDWTGFTLIGTKKGLQMVGWVCFDDPPPRTFPRTKTPTPFLVSLPIPISFAGVVGCGGLILPEPNTSAPSPPPSR